MKKHTTDQTEDEMERDRTVSVCEPRSVVNEADTFPMLGYVCFELV